MRLNRESGLRELDKVVTKYGYVHAKPYSFVDHEYQIEIIRDTRSRISVRKCSQVGMSELMVQKILALAATLQHVRIIFTLPTKDMAMAFSKDRFDGAIDQSEFYSGLVEKASNSASQKKIGSCMLYITGSFGANSAISIPAEIIVSDEEDFSNDAVLGKLNSRLRHANMVDEHGNRGMRLRFSTPTVEDYGVDLGFQMGHQAYYMVRCCHCEHWVLPDFFHDFIIPGLDRSILEISRDDLKNPFLKFQDSWIKCPDCGKDLQSSLLDPARRQWVAKRPDVWDHSYQVYPWDVPKYNPPASIIKQLGDYPLKSDFYNFVIGLPYSDSENTFIVSEEHRLRASVVDIWFYQQATIRAQTVAGMDVGKTCHFVVLARRGKVWDLVWTEKITNTKDDPAVPKVLARFDYYRVQKMCIDSGPDITLVNSLVSAREGISAVVYVRSVSGLLPIEEKHDGDVINADRTKTLSLTLGRHNALEFGYPRDPRITMEIFEHLKTTKKIRERTADGSMTERFVRSSDTDHWVHALNYGNIAAMCVDDLDSGPGVAAQPHVGKVKVGSAAASAKENQAPRRRIGW